MDIWKGMSGIGEIPSGISVVPCPAIQSMEPLFSNESFRHTSKRPPRMMAIDEVLAKDKRTWNEWWKVIINMGYDNMAIYRSEDYNCHEYTSFSCYECLYVCL